MGVAKDVLVGGGPAQVQEELAAGRSLHARLIRSAFVISPVKRAVINMLQPIRPDPGHIAHNFRLRNWRWNGGRGKFVFGVQPNIKRASGTDIPDLKFDLPKYLSNGEFIWHDFYYNPSAFLLMRVPRLLLHGFYRSQGGRRLLGHLGHLSPDFLECSPEHQRLPTHEKNLKDANSRQNSCIYFEFPLYVDALLFGAGIVLVGGGGGFYIYGLGRWTIGASALGTIVLASCFTSTLCCDPVFLRVLWRALSGTNADSCQCKYRQQFQHNTKNVSQKLLTPDNLRITLNTARQDMANTLGTDKKIAVIAALTVGSSIRSIERMTGVHRDTIMRLGVKVGQGCTALLDQTMRNLPCARLEMDEIWGFVGKKDRNVRVDDDLSVGSVWTFCAIDADTKLVPCFKVGERMLPPQPLLCRTSLAGWRTGYKSLPMALRLTWMP
jgi:hypothetical protein